MTGRMVRMISIQFSLMEMGTTGWMFAVYFMACAEPMPKSQLFWIGTLISAATGVFSFLGRSASSLDDAWAVAAAAPAEVGVSESGGTLELMPWAHEWVTNIVDIASASAEARRFCFIIVAIMVCYGRASVKIKFSARHSIPLWLEDYRRRKVGSRGTSFNR